MTQKPTPPRVSHLMPLPVIADLLSPTYAKAHNRMPEEVYDEVKSGIAGAQLHQPILDAVWEAMKKRKPRLDEAVLLERLAKAMAKGGTGPRWAAASDMVAEKMTALFAFVDVNVGRASETARAALETERGRAMLQKSVDTAGDWLAMRLLHSTKGRNEVD